MGKFRLVFGVLMCAASMASFAHTRLLASLPEDGAVLDSSPSSVMLTFSAEVRVIKLTLLDDTGAPIEFEGPGASGPAADVEIALQVLPAGDYSLHWAVMGKDTHKVSGTLRFKIRPEQ
ncbi:MAG: copper resistance protein CopC [Gammaproteobacteria bacterium]|nr:copper resistance protein CopC [Gammaproteobacteria bacterium]